MKPLTAVLGTLLAGILVALAVAGSGVASIAGDEPHSAPLHALLTLVRDRAVAVQSRSVEMPDLADPALVALGAEHYAAMCTGCHLAPGQDDSDVRAGLYPQPPVFASATRVQAARAFWIIKHGLKATGMPAWGKTHDDRSIWGLVAFLQKLPGMSVEDYQAATANAGEGAPMDEPAHEHHHEHGAHDPARTAESAEAAVDAFTHALQAGDRAEAQRWLAPDVLIYESGGQESSRDEYVAHHMPDDMAFLGKAALQRLNRQAHGGSDIAWVTSRVRIKAQGRQKAVDVTGTETMVLTREPAGWRIRHIHWSSRESP